jgi:formiminoglutamase
MKKLPWAPTSTQLFFSRNDQSDTRWGEFVNEGDPLSPSSPSRFGLWGYADDEGIKLNGGRVGAKFAPEFIRRFFYRLTPPLNTERYFLSDYGDWHQGGSLGEQIQTISLILAKKLALHPMITLGGGHDYGAVDGAGFLEWHRNAQQLQKPLIINFDAHLDVRPTSKGLNSGTPFSWLLENHPNGFEFIEVGIQKQCSSPHHHQWAKEQGADILNLDYVQKIGLVAALRQRLAGTSPQQPCFISIDIDVFSQPLAPGCSQSWDAGLQYLEVVEAIRWLVDHKKVHLLGIYEVSPPLDVDHRTSKLAACLVDDFIRHHFGSLNR